MKKLLAALIVITMVLLSGQAYTKDVLYKENASTLTEYVDFLGNKTQDYSHEIAMWKSGMLKDMDRDELDLFIKNLIYLADIVVID